MWASIKSRWESYIGANGWHVDYFVGRRRLITGETSSGLLATRKIDGRWAYREATAEEVEEYRQSIAW